MTKMEHFNLGKFSAEWLFMGFQTSPCGTSVYLQPPTQVRVVGARGAGRHGYPGRFRGPSALQGP